MPISNEAEQCLISGRDVAFNMNDFHRSQTITKNSSKAFSKSLHDLTDQTFSVVRVLPKSSSWSSGTIVVEEVVPQNASLNVNTYGDVALSWQMPLNIFTSKRHGNLPEDKKLPKRIRHYYRRQDELISAFEGLNNMTDDQLNGANNETRALRKKASILAKLSFFINLVLLFGKAVAAVLSGSLAVITSVIDSAVDLVSGTLMWWSNRAMKRRDPYLYPQGRTKLEPVSIIVLSVIMALASVVMIRQSIEKIVAFILFDVQTPEMHNFTAVFCLTIPEMKEYIHMDGQSGPIFEVESIIICSCTVVIKLVLFFACRQVHTTSTQALAQDHRNDVISNTGALACGLIGYKLWKYADPIGAILISIYIIVSWFRTGCEQIKLLTGHTAHPEFLKKLTWIALNHHSKVTHIDTIRAFHFGNNFLVEVDIVLPSEMSMKEAHDIGEALQCKLEKLDEVERAFVHLDYEVDHHPGTEHKVV